MHNQKNILLFLLEQQFIIVNSVALTHSVTINGSSISFEKKESENCSLDACRNESEQECMLCRHLTNV